MNREFLSGYLAEEVTDYNITDDVDSIPTWKGCSDSESQASPLESSWQNFSAKNYTRLAWWCLTLQPYNFTVIHRPGKENANADGMSLAIEQQTSSIVAG